MRRWVFLITVLVLTQLPVLHFTCAAVESEEPFDARKVALEVYNLYEGDDEIGAFEVVLTNRAGQTRHRGLVRWKRRVDGVDEILLRVTGPADIRGTTVLTLQREGDDDRQFIYLPALKRTRRISTADRSQRFVGMDWNYEDFRRIDVNDFTYTALRIDTYDGHECYVYEALPKNDEVSIYGKQVHWIRKDNYFRVKLEQYDQQMRLWKITEVPDLRKVQGVWTAVVAIAEDLQAQHRTRLSRKWVEYNTGVEDVIFTTRAIGRQEYLGE